MERMIFKPTIHDPQMILDECVELRNKSVKANDKINDTIEVLANVPDSKITYKLVWQMLRDIQAELI